MSAWANSKSERCSLGYSSAITHASLSGGKSIIVTKSTPILHDVSIIHHLSSSGEKLSSVENGIKHRDAKVTKRIPGTRMISGTTGLRGDDREDNKADYSSALLIIKCKTMPFASVTKHISVKPRYPARGRE